MGLRFSQFIIIALIFSLSIIGAGYEWCQKSWPCGNYFIANFSLPNSSPCKDIPNPYNKSNNESFDLSISIEEYVIYIMGKEVPSVPVLDNYYYNNIRGYIEQCGYNYSSKRDFWIDNCMGNNSVGIHNNEPGQIWHMRYWQPLAPLKKLQVTIIIQNPTGKIPEVWSELLNKTFRVEVQ